LRTEAELAKVHPQDLRSAMLADAVFLLTYRSASVGSSGLRERHANRSSVWRLEPAGWQILFHQATPPDGFDQDARF
jgi:hypothetical protein